MKIECPSSCVATEFRDECPAATLEYDPAQPPYSGSLTAVTYLPGELAPDAGPRFLDLMKEAGIRYE